MNTVSYGYSGSWKDLLTSYNGTAISYDTIGEPADMASGSEPDMGSREEAVDFTKRGNECKLYI